MSCITYQSVFIKSILLTLMAVYTVCIKTLGKIRKFGFLNNNTKEKENILFTY